jgi:hypothetical protein
MPEMDIRSKPTWPDSSPAPIASRVPLVRLALASLGYARASYLGLLIILPGQATLIEGHSHRTLLLAAAAVAGAVVALPAGIALSGSGGGVDEPEAQLD